MSLNVSESYASWSKMFWWETTTSRFAIVSRFLQAHRQTAVRIRLATQITFCVRGVISPLLANLYMNRFLKYWRITGRSEVFRAQVVNYADDFVILSRGCAAGALNWTRNVMTRIGLTLNEAKTSIKQARKERFDFLGYSFGPHRLRKDGHED